MTGEGQKVFWGYQEWGVGWGGWAVAISNSTLKLQGCQKHRKGAALREGWGGGRVVVEENLVGTTAWVCLFPCQGFIDRESSPIAWAAFDLPGRNWDWDFWRKGGEGGG